MIGVTFGVAAFFVILALSRRNSGTALGILIASMLIWPEYLRVPVGPIQMSVPRIVAILLLVKFFINGRHRQINFEKTDALMIWLWGWSILATVLANSEFAQISYIIGRGMDTVLMYFVARIGFTAPDDARGLFSGLAIASVVMCIAGVYEAVTWHSPYHRFADGAARIDEYEEVRYGFLRAQASTLVSIYFGMAMMLVCGLLWSIRGYVKRSLVTLAACVATLSSVSSGPWLALIALVVVNWYYRRPSLIKPSLWALLVLSIGLELGSNRHFYNLIDYLALDSSSAWYRARILEVAVVQWRDYWLVGVGDNWPHHWAAMVDGRQFIDVVNNFLIVALYGGIPALLMYIMTHVIAVKRTVLAFQQETDTSRKQLIFGLAAALIALDFSSMSVGLYGPALLLSHVLLGCTLSAAVAWGKGDLLAEQASLSRG